MEVSWYKQHFLSYVTSLRARFDARPGGCRTDTRCTRPLQPAPYICTGPLRSAHIDKTPKHAPWQTNIRTCSNAYSYLCICKSWIQHPRYHVTSKKQIVQHRPPPVQITLAKLTSPSANNACGTPIHPPINHNKQIRGETKNYNQLTSPSSHGFVALE